MLRKFVVQLSWPAKKDFASIISYYSDELEDPLVAEKVRVAIENRKDNLSFLPEGNPRVPEEPYFSAGVRMAHVKRYPYTLYYVVDNENKVVNIANILHNRRNRKIAIDLKRLK